MAPRPRGRKHNMVLRGRSFSRRIRKRIQCEAATLASYVELYLFSAVISRSFLNLDYSRLPVALSVLAVVGWRSLGV
jgi:hypothetical protein